MSRDLFDLMGGDEADVPMNGEQPVQHDKIELEMVLHYDTGNAVQVSDTGEEARAVWLPKSQIQLNPSGKKVPSVKKDGQREILPVVSVNIPEWLAKNKGLI
jgi:hypothetical protein